MEIYRTPDGRFDALPGYGFEPHYLELGGDLDGLRMHYVVVGAGPPIVLLHGEPTWSYLYRKMIGPLAGSHRVIAPDLIGFGRSDKPTDLEWYSYDRHVDSVVQLLEKFAVREATLVVQDWGGPIGLRIAVERPEHFSRLVILNTGIMRPGPNWPTPAFKQWLDFAKGNPDLPIGLLIQASTVTDVPAAVIAAYEAPWPTAASKAGPASFPLLVPLTADDPGAHKMMATNEALRGWGAPVLVAFSDSDPIFPQGAGERLAARIPGASFVPITGASHFLQEDKGEEIAELILDWLG